MAEGSADAGCQTPRCCSDRRSMDSLDAITLRLANKCAAGPMGTSSGGSGPAGPHGRDPMWSAQQQMAQQMNTYIMRPASCDPLALRQMARAVQSTAAKGDAGTRQAAACALAAQMFW